jgi:hypothetical protein
MKWPGGEANGMLSHTNGHVSSPQIIRQQVSILAHSSCMSDIQGSTKIKF